MAAMGTSSCNPDAPQPQTPLRKYAPDYRTQQLLRKGESPISFNDPLMDEMLCGWRSEIEAREKEMIDISLKCQKWAK
jgi:hypothetical protein